jgi:hypothetical protein
MQSKMILRIKKTNGPDQLYKDQHTYIFGIQDASLEAFEVQKRYKKGTRPYISSK